MGLFDVKRALDLAYCICLPLGLCLLWPDLKPKVSHLALFKG